MQLIQTTYFKFKITYRVQHNEYHLICNQNKLFK